MRREEGGDVDGMALPEDGRAAARRIRLPLCTWQGLLGVVAVMAAGAALVGEDAEPKGAGGREVAFSGHTGLVDTLRFSADGRTLLSSGWDKTVRIWGLNDSESEFGEELARLSTGVEIYSAAISPDGRTVAVAGLDGLSLVKALRGAGVRTPVLFLTAVGGVDDRVEGLEAGGGGLSLWDWAGGGGLRRPSRPVGVSRSIAFSPDGRLLAVGGYDRGIHLIDVQTGRVESSLPGHRDVIRKLAFAADGGRLLSLSYDGRFKSWDVASGKESVGFSALDDVKRPILTFALSPDGRDMALSRLHETDGRVEIWDVAAGALRATCRGAGGEVHALAFSQDGGVLASCGSDLALRFWDPKTGRSSGVLEGPMGWIRTLDFSADGRWMATSCVPDEVRLRRVGLPRRHVAPATANAEGGPSRRADAA